MGLLDIFRISQIKEENERLKSDNATLQAKINSLGVNEYYETKQKIEELDEILNSLSELIRTLSRINNINPRALNNSDVARLDNAKEILSKHYQSNSIEIKQSDINS